MTPVEAQILLATAAAFDNRKPDPTGAAAESWAAALDGVNIDDAKRAIVDHYRETRDWIMPADIRSRVESVRRERVRAAGDLSDRIPLAISQMDDGPEHHAVYQAWLQEATRRIGDGENVDEVAPRLRLVRGGEEQIKAITEKLAKDMRAPGARPRDEGETA